MEERKKGGLEDALDRQKMFVGSNGSGESDVEFELVHLPAFIYYLILPIGIINWVVRYNKLCRVRDKFGLALSKMNTADFI